MPPCWVSSARRGCSSCDRRRPRRPNSHARALGRRYQLGRCRTSIAAWHRDPVRVVRWTDGQGAHLPELRFALGEPGIETTTIDNAARRWRRAAFSSARKATDGFQFGFKPTLKKVVNDRRASLDEEEFWPRPEESCKRSSSAEQDLPVIPFPRGRHSRSRHDETFLVVLSPEQEWTEDGALAPRPSTDGRAIEDSSPRLYPGALIWCVRKQGRDLSNKVESCLHGATLNEIILGRDASRGVRPHPTAKKSRPNLRMPKMQLLMRFGRAIAISCCTTQSRTAD